MHKVFSILFTLTGIFAIAGGLYTWGDGIILTQTELIKVLIPWADIILTGQLSIICGIGIYKRKDWAEILGLVVSGMYVFGSLLVFINLVWNGYFSLLLFIPAISGLLIGMGYIVIVLRKNQL